jgi:hypothetical protein
VRFVDQLPIDVDLRGVLSLDHASGVGNDPGKEVDGFPVLRFQPHDGRIPLID